ncbi:MAG TPA: hypothetical protein VEW28_05365 [Candidatus Kapabacteria bacterium]|nr:hypothetical protein [Candidatus Kapabacteria bacterium]
MRTTIKTTLVSIALVLAIGAGTSITAFAQTATDPQAPANTTVAPGAVKPKPKMNINARQRRQQARIKQGINSGELTRGEATTLEKQEAAIQAQKLEDKAQNGGKLTGAEHKQIEHELNHESRKIYRKKHNEIERHPKQ